MVVMVEEEEAPICPSFPPLLQKRKTVLTGKQGQSPCMHTCVSDLHAHATFTGMETQTHKIPNDNNSKGPTNMHTHMHPVSQPLAQTTGDTHKHTH